MKLPFLSAKAESVVNKAVDIAGEKVQKAVHAAADDKLCTIAVVLPMLATAYLIFSDNRHGKAMDIPYKVIINNYYYYGKKE